MANTKKVTILVNAYDNESIYMCGNIPQLGGWDPLKAIELKRMENGLYSVTKMLPVGQLIEFKFMAERDWETVEKGYYDEELDNHILLLPTEDIPVYTVEKFSKK